MKKYKAVVKYKIEIEDVMEISSNGASPSQVAADIKEHISSDVYGASDFFNADDVSISYEVADITPVEE